MKVVSVNVSLPKRIEVNGGTVLTSIFKSPVADRVAVRAHNIDGDRQADLTVHGGPNKAVYAYAQEHYSFWRGELPDRDDFAPGMFGENLTTAGLDEAGVNIGDRYRVGSAVLQVTQPRMPCYKLGIRFNRADMVKRFWASGRPGIYFSIVEEGELAAGDHIHKLDGNADGISIADVVALYRGIKTDPELLQRALRAPLFGGWKAGLLERSQTEPR
ncbi:MAG TPA: MOSC domain-containing protein [Bryobacteraceae bacterium]|nr:MOSC domain-containing protein [Bryobacteraceae bacterium]